MTDRPEPAGLEALATAIGPVAERFVDAGHRIYLVGGVVRDLIRAGDQPFDPGDNDIDLTTDAEPAVIKRLVAPLAHAVWTQGERFGTIGATVSGQALEITTHRAEAYDPESRKPVVSFGTDLDEDLSRRDFTINAAAIELPGRVLHDPFSGVADLAAGVLRTPLEPAVSFSDDPLRMLRAARFVARFDLDPSPELVEAATSLAERITIVSVERISHELERLLAVDEPGPGLGFLAATGVLGHVFPAYAADRSAGATAVALAGRPGPVVVKRAGLLWPARDAAASILSGLRYSRADRIATTRLLAGVDRVLSAGPDQGDGGVGRPTVRRIAAAVGADNLDLVAAVAANVVAVDRPGDDGLVRRFEETVSSLVAEEDLDDLTPPLSGNEIMEALGIQPGPEVGLAERHLRELRLERGPLTPESARRELKIWQREQAESSGS